MPHQFKETKAAILRVLAERGSCTLEALIQSLPGFTWNQIFMAVDELGREDKLTLSCSERFTFSLSTLNRRVEKECRIWSSAVTYAPTRSSAPHANTSAKPSPGKETGRLLDT